MPPIQQPRWWRARPLVRLPASLPPPPAAPSPSAHPLDSPLHPPPRPSPHPLNSPPPSRTRLSPQDRTLGGGKAQRRAITEAAITSSVSHPNVVATLSYDLQPLQHGGAGAMHPGLAQVADWCAARVGGKGAAEKK